MDIQIPPAVEAAVRAKAAAAGFADISEYVLTLIELDVPQSGPEDTARIARLLDDGLASGEPIVVDEAFWSRQQAEREQVLDRTWAPRV